MIYILLFRARLRHEDTLFEANRLSNKGAVKLTLMESQPRARVVGQTSAIRYAMLQSQTCELGGKVKVIDLVFRTQEAALPHDRQALPCLQVLAVGTGDASVDQVAFAVEQDQRRDALDAVPG